MSRVIILIYFFILTLTSGVVSAIGIGVSPAKLLVNFESMAPITREITLVNTGSIPSRYRLYTDDYYRQYLTFSANEITVKPSGHKKIMLTFRT